MGIPGDARLMRTRSVLAYPMLSNTARLALLLAAFGCTGVAGDAALQTRSYTDEGSVCLSPRGAGGAHVQVLINECESACASVEASCSVSLVGGVIVVESDALASVDPDVEICPTVCQAVITACTLPELPDGNYELRYGARTVTVTMPVPIAGTLAVLDSRQSTDEEPCERLPLLP
jgi:hypothetical protein